MLYTLYKLYNLSDNGYYINTYFTLIDNLFKLIFIIIYSDISTGYMYIFNMGIYFI